MTEPEAINAREFESEHFYEGAYSRIIRTMAVLSASGTIIAWAWYGSRAGIGFLAGCGLAAINLLWLKRTVTILADRTIGAKAAEEKPSRGAVWRFVLRYALFGAIAYVIFKSSLASLSGVLAGLFLPVAAILVEAAYESYAALRRGL